MANEVLVFEAIGDRSTGESLPVNFLAKQTLSIGGAVSSAFNASTQQVVIVTNTDCAVEFGSAPDGNGHVLPLVAGHIYKFSVPSRSKVIAVAGTATSPKVNPGTVTVTGPLTNAQFIAGLQVTPAFTSVNSANSSTQLLAANANRKGLIIVNTDANDLYVDISGGTASTTRYCKKIAASGGEWECPFAPVTAVTGIWSADGAGAALITELT